jgi:hypothetical protein
MPRSGGWNHPAQLIDVPYGLPTAPWLIHPFGFGDPCLPTATTVVPLGSQWLHEIKHDGCRLMVRRTRGAPVRRLIRNASTVPVPAATT